MTASGSPASSVTRLQRLKTYLQQDPHNIQLIADAAAAAMDEDQLRDAAELLDRYEALAPLPPALLNIKGLAAIGDQRFEEAAAAFESLLAAEGSAPVLKFNLAWCRSMLGDHVGALDLLDDETVAAVPASAALKVRTLHHLGRPEEALEVGARLAEHYPEDKTLMGTLAIAALDAEAMDHALAFATRASDRPDGQSVLGLLALGDNDVEGSLALFDQALIGQPDNARALIGKGLGLLTKGDTRKAIDMLERGAAVFGDHLGSWIAVGWAQFSAGDYAASRATFEKTLALDDTFAESHGALAVLDVMDGDLDSARRRSETALRLDRQCLSAALAQSLIAAGAGDTDRAERIRTIALNAPVGPGGRTIAQSMVSMGVAAGPRRREI